MGMKDANQRLVNGGGRMTKWKGQAASLAPSLILGTVSATALMVPLAFAETVTTERTTAFVSSVDEDHTITDTGAVRVTPSNDNALVEINLADYTRTLSNQGTIESTNATGRTQAGIAVNGILSGAVANSGDVTLQATGGSSADLRGIDVDLVTGSVDNAGRVSVSATASADARAVGITGNDVSGTLTNAGEIAATASGTSAFAAGIYVRAVSGDVENTGTITATANGTGPSATAYGARLIGVSGSFLNSGTIDVSSTAGSEASSYGVRAFDISGDVTNTGTVRVAATGVTSANAYGLDFDTIETAGTLSNSGTVAVAVVGALVSPVYDPEGYAVGIGGHAIDGSLRNSGDVTVDVLRWGEAIGEGIRSSTVSGQLENSGAITVQTTTTVPARSSTANLSVATGIAARTVTGSITNSGTITAQASGRDIVDATGIRADSVDLGGTVTNSGSIVVAARSSSSSADADGMRVVSLSGTLANSGTIQVTAQSNYHEAHGMWALHTESSGRIENSGNIAVSGLHTSGTATGIYTGGLDGTLLNSGTISVRSEGYRVTATGLSAGRYRDLYLAPSEGVSGALSNTGVVTVAASGTGTVEAFGVSVGRVEGSVSNSGTISVTGEAEHGGLATGIAVESVETAGRVTNSGTIAVTADYSDARRFYVAGIGSGLMEGQLINEGRIQVTARQAAPSAADPAVVAGIGVLEVAGTMDHSGTIDVTSSGGANSEAYGIYAETLSGQINVSGAVTVQGVENSYAIYLGDGDGVLNIDTSAEIDGAIRVADHDVNLTHSGGTRVYRFEDANTAAGTFTTDVTIENGVWFVDDEGGAAPVYTAAVGEDFSVNTVMPFELSGLSGELSQELNVQGGPQVSRNATFENTTSTPLRSFARFGYSHSKGRSGTGADRARLGSLTAGVTGQAQDLRYGVGLSFASGRSTQGTNTMAIDGGYLSAMVAKDFGFADLSFGIGWGAFDHTNRRTIAGSADAVGDYHSTLKTAQVGISRAFQLSDRVTLTPRAGYLIGEQHIDGYTETGSSANASFAARNVQFEEAQLGVSLSTSVGAGVMSASLDVVHRKVDSPEVIDVSIFGTTTALATGGTEDDTFGQLGLSYQHDLGASGLLCLSANRRFGARTQDHYLSAEMSWMF
jgi:hypothetical protein